MSSRLSEGFWEKLRLQLKRHEGVRKVVYFDGYGVPTVGVGFNLLRRDARERLEAVGLNLGSVLAGVELSDEQVERLLDLSIRDAVEDARSVFTNYEELDDVRKRVLIDLAFNLGRGKLLKFKRLVDAVKKKDYNKAALALTNSLWFHQVKVRGIRLAAMLLDGVDHF